MIQLVTPNFNLPRTFVLNSKVLSYAGWCQKWVDDAGGVPNSLPPRQGTAKLAFTAEANAGRIRSGDSPIGVWVVGFLDFTSGPYTQQGHVFFMKHLGNGVYEIRDSEVGSGARDRFGGPYRSIAEILAWFSVYSPKFIGWSTQCDGQTYAKEEQDMSMWYKGATYTPEEYKFVHDLFVAYLKKEPTEKEMNDLMANDKAYFYAVVADYLADRLAEAAAANKNLVSELSTVTVMNAIPDSKKKQINDLIDKIDTDFENVKILVR